MTQAKRIYWLQCVPGVTKPVALDVPEELYRAVQDDLSIVSTLAADREGEPIIWLEPPDFLGHVEGCCRYISAVAGLPLDDVSRETGIPVQAIYTMCAGFAEFDNLAKHLLQRDVGACPGVYKKFLKIVVEFIVRYKVLPIFKCLVDIDYELTSRWDSSLVWLPGQVIELNADIIPGDVYGQGLHAAFPDYLKNSYLDMMVVHPAVVPLSSILDIGADGKVRAKAMLIGPRQLGAIDEVRHWFIPGYKEDDKAECNKLLSMFGALEGYLDAGFETLPKKVINR